MQRRILMIKGYSKNEKELDNDRKFINLYEKYFESNAGGVYNRNTEITIFEEPSLNKLNEFEKYNKDSDSLIVILIGHGANKNKKQIFQLQENLIINPGQIHFSIKKQLFIIESCRNIIDYKIKIEDLNGLIPKFKHGGVIKPPKTQEEAREKYNKKLDVVENGTTYLFASSVNESAINYWFIHYLIKISRYYHEYSFEKIYDIQHIFKDTKNKVFTLSKGSQNPEMKGEGQFPFVVSII